MTLLSEHKVIFTRRDMVMGVSSYVTCTCGWVSEPDASTPEGIKAQSEHVKRAQ